MYRSGVLSYNYEKRNGLCNALDPCIIPQFFFHLTSQISWSARLKLCYRTFISQSARNDAVFSSFFFFINKKKAARPTAYLFGVCNNCRLIPHCCPTLHGGSKSLEFPQIVTFFFHFFNGLLACIVRMRELAVQPLWMTQCGEVLFFIRIVESYQFHSWFRDCVSCARPCDTAICRLKLTKGTAGFCSTILSLVNSDFSFNYLLKSVTTSWNWPGLTELMFRLIRFKRNSK